MFYQKYTPHPILQPFVECFYIWEGDLGKRPQVIESPPLFLKKVGLSPKYFSRIRRVSNICNIMAHNEKLDWANVVYSNGYFDQAHFIKEFMKESPTIYWKDNLELMRFLEE